MSIVQGHTKRCSRYRFVHRALNFDHIFFRHVPLAFLPELHDHVPRASHSRLKIRGGPLGSITIVCSKCAERLPSTVTAVHRSSRTLTAGPPMLTIGSIATTIPACNRGPCPAFPSFGTCGSS